MLDKAIRTLPGPQCEVFFATLGGAVGRVASDATAFPQRAAHSSMNVHTRWDDPAEDAACIAWARAFFDAAKPHALDTVYINFIPDDEVDRLVGAYGGNMERLAAIKARYDPENRLRLNYNIAPAKVAAAAH